MTISSQTRKAGPFTGNGVTTTFPFTFKVFAASDLYVVRTGTNGNDTVLVLGTDYTVALNTNQNSSPGGSITLPAALAIGVKLTATSALPYLQPTDLTNQGGFYPAVINNALDRLTIFCQQLLDQVGRSLKISIATPAGVNTTLPAPASNKLIGWNEAADNLQNMDPGTLATIVAFGTAKADIFSGTGSQTTFTLTANPGTLNNLDVAIGGETKRPGIDYTWSSGTTITFTTAPAAGTNNVLVRYLQGLPQGVADADAVTFLQSGTGAVARTVQDKLRCTIHVTDFDIGSGVTDDRSKIQTLLNEVAASGGGEIIFNSNSDYLVSDWLKVSSNTVLRFTGAGFIKLTQSSYIGGVLIVFGTSAAPAENVTIINPRIDANNMGHPKGQAYGENGIGGSKCRHVTVIGGIVKNCRRGSSNAIGTGGKAVQFEDGVDDILVSGLTAEDCTVAMETGGVVDIVAPYEFRRFTGVQYKNMRAIRCDRVISVQQTDSPPQTSVNVGNAQIDGVIAFNCGRESVSGTEKDFGAIVLDRASNISISNFSLFNEASYGTLGALVRQPTGTNCIVKAEFTGNCDALVLHAIGNTGFGATGNCQDNAYTLVHKGVTNYVISYIDSPLAQENLYDVQTDVITTGFVNAGAALASLYLRFVSGGKGVTVDGTALNVYAYLGNNYPVASFAVGGTMRVNGMIISVTTGAQLISSTGTDVLRLQYLGSNRIDCNLNGVSIYGIPTYSNNEAASAAGLPVGQVYTTATGDLFIRY